MVRGEGGLILVDPGIDGSDLNQFADDVDRLGIPVVAGFSAADGGAERVGHLAGDDRAPHPAARGDPPIALRGTPSRGMVSSHWGPAG